MKMPKLTLPKIMSAGKEKAAGGGNAKSANKAANKPQEEDSGSLKSRMAGISLPNVAEIDFKALAEDFKDLDPKDIGAWPLAPRIAVLFVFFIGLLVAGWFLFWSSQFDDLDAKRAQESKLKDDFLSKKRQAANLDEYRKQLAEIDRSFGALLRQLPNKSEMESLLIDINQAGLGRGLQFELFKPGSETIKDFYAQLPITVTVTGGYHDLGAFAGDVAKLARIVNLGELNVETVPGGQLKMNAVATTYRYLDENEIAQAKQQKAKAGGAK